MSVGAIRKAITLPAAGVFVELPVSGYSVIVELSPDNTVADVPLLRVGSRGSSQFPAYSGAQYHFPDRFERVFIEGTAATGTLYLLVVTSKGVRIDFPGTAT